MYMRSLFAAAAISLVSILAHAQDADTAASSMFSPEGVSAAQVAEILQSEGYRAKLDEDSQGDPMIRSKMSGFNVQIFFYQCNEDVLCEDIQFHVGFDLDDGMTAEDVEAWNRQKRFAKIYRDDEDDPYLEIDLQLVPGGTPELVKGYIATTDIMVALFADHIGF